MHLGTLCVGVTAPDVEITIVRSIGLANHPEDGRVRPDDRGGRCLVLQNIKSSAAILTGIMHEPGGVFVFFFVGMGIACILYGDRELMECVVHHSQRMGSNNDADDGFYPRARQVSLSRGFAQWKADGSRFCSDAGDAQPGGRTPQWRENKHVIKQ